MHDKLIEMLQRSFDQNQGINLYLRGNTLALVVTEVIGTEAIIGRNQEFDTILVPLNIVDAFAMN